MNKKDSVHYYGALSQARSSLNQLLTKELRHSADGRKHISHATMADRSQFFNRLPRELHELGYRIRNIHHFKPKHAQALIRHWESQQVSASTLQKRWSYLNLLCRWIGKRGMLGDAGDYLVNRENFRRQYAARCDQSWTGQGADPGEVLARVVAKDVNVARTLCFQLAFGLRLQEASLIRPKQDDHGQVLQVIAGTKGGRPRTVPIETASQRAILDEAQQMITATGQHSLIPLRYNLRQWLNRCYTVFRACGLTRIEGIVSHGARHQYANDLFEQFTGVQSPVRGGDQTKIDPHIVEMARTNISLRLGHARESISNAYLGRASGAYPKNPQGTDIHLWEATLREQRLLLNKRLKPFITYRDTKHGHQRIPISPSTLNNRQRLLNQWVGDWMRLGCPLVHPDQLSEQHIDQLLALWSEHGRLDTATVKNRCQFLAQVCRWLNRNDLAERIKQPTFTPSSTLTG